jgi:hypothetical protein
VSPSLISMTGKLMIRSRKKITQQSHRPLRSMTGSVFSLN